MSENAWTLLIAGLTGLVTAIGTAAASYLTTRQKVKREDDDAVASRYEKLLEIQSKELDKLKAELEVFRGRLEALSREHMNCHSAMNALYTWATFSYAMNVKFAKALNLDPLAEVPPLPPRPVLQIFPDDPQAIHK